MPPIALHMVLAHRLSPELLSSSLQAQPGALLLGSTAPDIRILTRQDRRSTHFFDLNTFEHQDSVAAFLDTHDHLADPSQLNDATLAFVAGYLTHLVFDEQYITTIYRRHFLRHETIGGAIRANVMDRLLQFDLERKGGEDLDLRQEIVSALSGTIENIDTGFIGPDTLEQWRQVNVDIATRGMDWDRARGMIANHLRRASLEEGETLSGFLDSLPELLDETIAHVTSSEIEAYLERSTEAARRAVSRYLECG